MAPDAAMPQPWFSMHVVPVTPSTRHDTPIPAAESRSSLHRPSRSTRKTPGSVESTITTPLTPVKRKDASPTERRSPSSPASPSPPLCISAKMRGP